MQKRQEKTRKDKRLVPVPDCTCTSRQTGIRRSDYIQTSTPVPPAYPVSPYHTFQSFRLILPFRAPASVRFTPLLVLVLVFQRSQLYAYSVSMRQ